MAKVGKIQWYGDEFSAAMTAGLRRGLLAASAHLHREVVKDLSKSGGQPGLPGGAKHAKKGGRPPRRVARSKPGQPPFAVTGKLRQSIFHRLRGKTVGDMHAIVGTTLKYGAFMELGTKRHPISATRRKMLAFPGKLKNPKLGSRSSRIWDWIFVRKVMHPGTAPRPFLKPALQRESNRIVQFIVGHAQASIASKKLGGKGKK